MPPDQIEAYLKEKLIAIPLEWFVMALPVNSLPDIDDGVLAEEEEEDMLSDDDSEE